MELNRICMNKETVKNSHDTIQMNIITHTVWYFIYYTQ